ncbi:prolyl 3-hydroxylase 1 [Neolamprologus brichardi]|uniref:prolyl 3-hydroxylase 1 n=1 Tax=Neolamprologus brichardi TaxID=32507 RepID=UPI001643AEDB|nr:prolyl 3-hydroxylase 1 [Neolamprologus brichardi]
MELRYALTFLCAVVVPACTSDTEVSSHFVLEPYDFLFDTAVEAYYKGDWLSVILNMEKALKNKATLRKVKAQCRQSCANQTAFGEPLAGLGVPIPGTGSVEDLGFFQKILKRADCVNSCETEKVGAPSLHLVSEEIELEFKKRSPYNYLQVAYFKINKLAKAVAAANTFFQANPDHMEMRQNLDYYRMMAGVQEDDFKDLEARPHMAQFLLGKSSYSDDSFILAAEHFESAVDEYFIADKECRVLCEGAYDYDGYNYMEYSADLFQSMSDHYLQVLSCKQHCAVELALTAGRDKPFEDFLPSHFNYLQFSYYNTEKYEKAIECAKTFLLFHPEDEVMNQNLNYYSAVLGEDKAAAISARQDSWTPDDVMPKKLREKQKAERETAARITEEIGNLMKEIENLVEEKKKDSSEMTKIIVPQEDGALLYSDIKVTMTSKQLNGSQRVLLDGVITDEECRELHRLSNAAALKGDGYRGRPSPHSPSEMYQGVTVLKAVKLGQEGKVPLKSARLFFDLSEKVRKVLESYFRLDTPLYFTYSHLVCRSAIDEKQDGRKDMSHPVHADNCVLVSEVNECVKEPPAYTYRDYSAILYLNEDFGGGEFIFTELDAKTVTERIQAQDLLKMFSTPVDAEFSKNEAMQTESQPLPPEAPARKKEVGEQKLKLNTSGDAQTDLLKDAGEAKTASKGTTKTKAAPKTKPKAGDQTKAKTTGKVKAAAAKDGKQTAKTKAKQGDKQKTKPAAKKTVKAVKKDSTSAPDSQSNKEEL